MNLIKAIHMPNWSVELFQMDRTGSFALVGQNHLTGKGLTRMVRYYDTASDIFDMIVIEMLGN